MKNSPRQRKPASPAPPTGAGFSAVITMFLATAVVGLSLVLWRARQPVGRVKLASGIPVYDVSPKTTFNRISVSSGATNAATRITNVQIVDFDKDGLNDILVCDAARNEVILYHQRKDGTFEERVLGANLKVP